VYQHLRSPSEKYEVTVKFSEILESDKNQLDICLFEGYDEAE
jgi:hypothetical protein